MARGVSLLVLMVVAGLAIAAADDHPKPRPARPAPEPGWEDAAGRGFRKAPAIAECEALRATLFKPDYTEEQEVAILVEMANGDLFLYQGGKDPKGDRFVLIEKRHLRIFEDAVRRQKGNGN